MENVEGIVESMRKDKKGIKVGDIWYSNFNQNVPCEWKDKVKVEYEITEKDGRTYHNWAKIEVLEKGEAPRAPETETRIKVDAGNCVLRGTELFVAGKTETLMSGTLEAVAAFKAAENEL